MEQVTVTGLDRVRDPKPTINGHHILAYFTADVGVFTIKGCALVRTARGSLAAWLPSLTDPRAKANRSIALNDEPTRNALLQAALKMYRMMGGTDAERDERPPLGRPPAIELPPVPPSLTRVSIPVTRRIVRIDKEAAE